MTSLNLLSEAEVTCAPGGAVPIVFTVSDATKPVVTCNGLYKLYVVKNGGQWEASWVADTLGEQTITVEAGDATPLTIQVTVEGGGGTPPARPGDDYDTYLRDITGDLGLPEQPGPSMVILARRWSAGSVDMVSIEVQNPENLTWDLTGFEGANIPLPDSLQPSASVRLPLQADDYDNAGHWTLTAAGGSTQGSIATYNTNYFFNGSVAYAVYVDRAADGDEPGVAYERPADTGGGHHGGGG